MLPNNVIDAIVEGDLDGETVKMEIDATATAHIMSVLTDLYSDRLMAVVREYATNALDAHIEAGVTRPIEITLPNRMSSYYHVKDWGIGLDVDGIRNIYSKYGKSTKRGSNDFNGMLGLGCKSAMTYAAQFSIISVKDGMKYNVSVSRGADGVGEMQVIDSTPTTEENGVEIVIPIKTSDVYNIANKVQSFFQWWPEGTVLVNGAAPKRFEGREIVKNLYMVDGLEKDLIIMGNVPYPVPYEDGIFSGEKDVYGYSRKTFGVVYFAEMGDVTFAPSRESLQTTRTTRTTVDKAKELFIKNLKTSMQKEIDVVTNPIEAMKHYRRVRTRYNEIDFSDMTYRGKRFEAAWSAPFKMRDVEGSFGTKRQVKDYDYFFWYNTTGGSSETKLEELDAQRVETYQNSITFIVNGPKSLSSHQRTKIRRVYDNGDITTSYVLITPESKPPGGFWTASLPVVDWSIVAAYKFSTNGTSDKTKHNVHQPDGTMVNRAVPDAEKVVYVSPTFFNRDDYYRPKMDFFVKFFNGKGYSMMTLNANRHAKFAREHKNSMPLDKALGKFVNDYNSSLTAQDLVYIGMEDEEMNRIVNLKGLDIDDPDVVALVKATDRDEYLSVNKNHKYYQSLARYSVGASLTDGTKVKVFENYPLVKCLSSNEVHHHRQHVCDYINAVYNSKKGD